MYTAQAALSAGAEEAAAAADEAAALATFAPASRMLVPQGAAEQEQPDEALNFGEYSGLVLKASCLPPHPSHPPSSPCYSPRRAAFLPSRLPSPPCYSARPSATGSGTR